jgi:hypothetical protein
MNQLKKLFAVAALTACVLPVAAQYPVIPDSVKIRGEEQQKEIDRKSDEAWAKALPVVMSEAVQGRPYKPWASKPEDLIKSNIPAFPGAEGGGAYTPGGRGGKVIVVNSLADSGPGTLREACETGGARIVVFNVSGVIRLKTPINVRAPYITIAGQTAPGDGVCVTGASFLLDTHDIIIRHMRFRRGAQDVFFRDDALGGNCVGNVIIDHCSASWGYDQDADAVVWNYRWSETKEDGSQLHYYTENEGSSPAIVRKMSDPAENSANTYQWDGTDVYEYRYAELLLNLAECYAATGDISNSVKTIGEIRARVGIPASNNYGLGTITDKNEAIKACLRERQVELAYEGKRYWDLWRWMLYNDDASDNNTTCTTLGIEPLNGTARVGKYLQVKDYDGKADPLVSVIADFEPVDVDNAADLQAEMNRLGEFWSQHFVLQDRETPVDNVNGQEAVISWQENYYLSGLPSNVLNMNPWLEQSKGWLDYYESEGTLDARK